MPASGAGCLASAGPVNWSELESHERIRKLMAELIPGLEPLADIDRTRAEFHIPGRRLDTPTFPTASGKAQFQAVALPAPPEADSRLNPDATAGHRLRLMTVRSEGQFNTVVYEEEDIYRGQERRDVIMIHPSDMERMGLARDQRVTVRSAVGRIAGAPRASV